MKTIIITGPSGSGKSYITNRLMELLDNTIVIKTDSYYKDDILIKLLSILRNDIYDRNISFKRKDLMNTLQSIYNKENIAKIYFYDFKVKKSVKSKINLNYKDNNQLLILEGIFAHRLNLNYQKTINIECVEKKEICYKRRLKRDTIERGRKINEVNDRFSRSWDLFYKNIKYFKIKNHVISLNSSEITDENLIHIVNSKLN